MVEKVTRVAFLYLEPKASELEGGFAQCGSCRMFVPEVRGLAGARCVIHGSKQEVDGEDSCGFYVEWPTPDGKPNEDVVKDHAEELAKGIPGSVTAAESGLVGKVQCHRCAFAKSSASVCGLYQYLNKVAKYLVDLDEKIKPHACCNAWTPKGGSRDD